MKKIHISDKEGRPLIKIKDGRVIVARYANMNEKTKSLIAEIYKEITDENSNDIKDFLDFKNDELEFCS
jgi:trans-2-enoyl-CoA reductase